MYDNKVLISLYVLSLGKNYELFLPVNEKVGNILSLLDKALGKFYEDALDKLRSKQMASITEQVASGKMTKEIGDRCKEYLRNGLKVVFE